MQILRSNKRIKDGQEHYTVVESRRLRSGQVAPRQVWYLGESNDVSPAAWRKTLEVFDEKPHRFTPLSLFPDATTSSAHHCRLANGHSSAPNVVETFEAPLLKQRAFRLPIGRTAKVGLGRAPKPATSIRASLPMGDLWRSPPMTRATASIACGCTIWRAGSARA